MSQRQLDHYLELLVHKPGALAGSLALHQERERGPGPGASTSCGQELTERYGPSEAARQMVDVLLLAREHGPASVELAVRGALTAGAHRRPRRRGARPPRAPRGRTTRRLTICPPRLQGLGAPAPTLGQYDELLDGGRTMSAPAKVQAMETLIEAHAVELKLPTVRRALPRAR